MPPPIPPDAPLRPEGRVAGRAHSGGTGMFVAFPFVWDPHRGPVLCEGRPHGPQSCPARWRLAPRFLLLTEKFPAQRRPWTGLERATEMLGFHAAPQRRPASGPGHRRGAVGCARGSLPETSKTGQLGARSGRRGAGRAGRFPRAARSRALGTPPARPSASGRHLAGRARPLEAMAAAPLPGPPWPLWVAKGAGPAASAPPKWAPCAPPLRPGLRAGGWRGRGVQPPDPRLGAWMCGSGQAPSDLGAPGPALRPVGPVGDPARSSGKAWMRRQTQQRMKVTKAGVDLGPHPSVRGSV